MKYLGIRIDDRWNLRLYFETVVGKANRIMNALNGIMQNLRGPGENKRRLYANTVYSVIMYGAPLWADIYGKGPKHKEEGQEVT